MNMNKAAGAIALMIALGVGVDYSLFIVSRFRARLADGRDSRHAAIESLTTAGRAPRGPGSPTGPSPRCGPRRPS
jgi:RND superfamily putative drug exporter